MEWPAKQTKTHNPSPQDKKAEWRRKMSMGAHFATGDEPDLFDKDAESADLSETEQARLLGYTENVVESDSESFDSGQSASEQTDEDEDPDARRLRKMEEGVEGLLAYKKVGEDGGRLEMGLGLRSDDSLDVSMIND